MKLLSIIIPYHTEKLKDVTPLFRSLNEQVGINFDDIEVILSKDTDLPNEIDDYDFSDYENLKGRVTKIRSDFDNNPGASRQSGVDRCNGTYVMFCDADDSLYNLCVLRNLFENINKFHGDIYRFKFIEEVGSFKSDVLEYLEHDVNWIWVFAKIYKVEFLRRNNIRFSPKLRWHEDTYFNLLCQYCKPNAYDIPIWGYLWRFSRTSITRLNDHEYNFTSIPDYLYATAEAFETAVKVYELNVTKDILAVINRYYYVLNNPTTIQKENFEDVERCYYNFIRRLACNLFKGIPMELQKIIAELPRSADQNYLPERTLADYFKYLESKYGGNK